MIKFKYNEYPTLGIEEELHLIDTETAELTPSVNQVMDVLMLKLAKRGIDVKALDKAVPRKSPTGKAAQEVTIRQGVDIENAKKIVKLLKTGKFKVQAAIQGQQVRVTGKKRDDLQQVMGFLKDQKLEIPLQYTNFRD